MLELECESKAGMEGAMKGEIGYGAEKRKRKGLMTAVEKEDETYGGRSEDSIQPALPRRRQRHTAPVLLGLFLSLLLPFSVLLPLDST